jgi:hypothetical protein
MAKDINGRIAAEVSWICGNRLAENGKNCPESNGCPQGSAVTGGISLDHSSNI